MSNQLLFEFSTCTLDVMGMYISCQINYFFACWMVRFILLALRFGAGVGCSSYTLVQDLLIELNILLESKFFTKVISSLDLLGFGSIIGRSDKYTSIRLHFIIIIQPLSMSKFVNKQVQSCAKRPPTQVSLYIWGYNLF